MMKPAPEKTAKPVNPVAAFLILAALSVAVGVTGVAVLFGLGWALIAASAGLALGAGLIWKGLKHSG
jgi:hypothetical protein